MKTDESEKQGIGDKRSQGMIDSDGENVATDGGAHDPAWLSRERLLALLFVLITLVALYLCFLLIEPFLSELAWALALAVISYPMHRWIARRMSSPGLAAGISMVAVGLLIVAPTVLVVQQLVGELTMATELIEIELRSGLLRERLLGIPVLGEMVAWIERLVSIEQVGQELVTSATNLASGILLGSIRVFIGLLIVLFTLFYFFRDKHRGLRAVESLMPLSRDEADRMVTRIGETVKASIYGTVFVALIQGALAGSMFWMLGLPLPVFWGIIMWLLSIIPIIGAYFVWIPAAIVLAADGEIVKAVILTGWGMVVVGLIDNVLYPMFVGHRIRIHTLPVFFAILGGLFLIGPAGIIVGPVILAIADGLIHIWKQRLACEGKWRVGRETRNEK